MKKILVLWADEISANMGVRVLARGTSALAERAWPGAEFEFQNFGSRNPHLPIGKLSSLVRERLKDRVGMQNWLGGFDLIMDTRSGDSFADIYGQRRLRIMSAVSEFATQAGTPVVLGPQTIGPFATRQGRALGRRALRRSALSMARDSASADYARSLRCDVDVVTTDVVFALPVPVVEKTRDVVLNISGLLWQESPHVDAATYRSTIRDLYRELTAQGRTVTLLAHVVDSPAADNDVPAIRSFADETAPGIEVIVPEDLDAVRNVVASARVVIGSRMHACLNALSVGTPTIPLAYSRKFDPLLRDLGWDATVDLRQSSSPVSDALTAMSGTDETAVPAVVARAQTLLAPAELALRGLA